VFDEAANTMKGEILFVNSGVSEGIQARLAEFVGVTAEDMPTMRILAPGQSMKKYNYSGDVNALTTESIKTFIEDFKAGKVEEFLKSEPIPETQEGPVTVVVGKSYEQIVNDPTKDVLVKFYAPWCGHCKKLEPVWRELAEKTADIEDLVIAKFDSTANEVSNLEIRGYPTLKFFPKDNKAGVAYEGDREVADFLKYFGEKSEAYKQHQTKSS